MVLFLMVNDTEDAYLFNSAFITQLIPDYKEILDKIISEAEEPIF